MEYLLIHLETLLQETVLSVDLCLVDDCWDDTRWRYVYDSDAHISSIHGMYTH